MAISSETLAVLNAEIDHQLHAIWQMTLTGWVKLADELGVKRNDRYGAARMLAAHVLRQRGVLKKAVR
jgi:4'-phosphopantetheinyl transferase EntD